MTQNHAKRKGCKRASASSLGEGDRESESARMIRPVSFSSAFRPMQYPHQTVHERPGWCCPELAKFVGTRTQTRAAMPWTRCDEQRGFLTRGCNYIDLRRRSPAASNARDGRFLLALVALVLVVFEGCPLACASQGARRFATQRPTAYSFLELLDLINGDLAET